MFCSLVVSTGIVSVPNTNNTNHYLLCMSLTPIVLRYEQRLSLTGPVIKKPCYHVVGKLSYRYFTF